MWRCALFVCLIFTSNLGFADDISGFQTLRPNGNELTTFFSPTATASCLASAGQTLGGLVITSSQLIPPNECEFTREDGSLRTGSVLEQILSCPTGEIFQFSTQLCGEPEDTPVLDDTVAVVQLADDQMIMMTVGMGMVLLVLGWIAGQGM